MSEVEVSESTGLSTRYQDLETIFLRTVNRGSESRVNWSKDELREMAQRIREAATESERLDACHALACTALRYMVRVANKYRSRTSRHVDMSDVFSVGYLGLLRAAEDYDPERGTFTTYATAWVRQCIDREFLNNGRTVRIPAHRVQVIYSFVRKREMFFRAEGRHPKNSEMAEIAGVSIKLVEELRGYVDNETSLDVLLRADADESDATAVDMLTDKDGNDPGDALDTQTIKKELSLLVERLPKRERDIITMRFGLGGEEPMTMTELAVIYGVTHQAIKHTQDKALRMLRKGLGGPEEFFL